MRTIRIVIVDDHQLFLDGLSFALSKMEEMEILSVFNNPVDAIKYLKNHEVDLLISDISMPQMNGIEFIKKAKQLIPHVKTLVVSMFPSIHEIPDINGYLLKESSHEELQKAIKQIMLEGENYYYSDYNKEVKETLEFKNSIITGREKEIIQLIAREKTVGEIAEQLFLSPHTIETHKKNIFLKLQVNNMAGLIKKALYLGYI
jgi:DNA-binding NarL/FixJ family response regulator